MCWARAYRVNLLIAVFNFHKERATHQELLACRAARATLQLDLRQLAHDAGTLAKDLLQLVHPHRLGHLLVSVLVRRSLRCHWLWRSRLFRRPLRRQRRLARASRAARGIWARPWATIAAAAVEAARPTASHDAACGEEVPSLAHK